MKIALMHVENKRKGFALNKDLVGGYGNLSCIGDSLFSKFLSFAKRNSIKLPVLSLAYLQAILKSRGHRRIFESAIKRLTSSR